MMGFKRSAVAAFAAMLLAISACSGAPAGATTDDPVGTVNAAIAAAESGGFAKLSDYACAAQKDDIANAFGGGNMSQLSQAGVDPNEIFDAMKVDFQDITATEGSKTDTEATVHLKGKVAISFDEAKMKEVIKKVIQAQGITATDQMVELAMTQMSSALSKTQDIDDDMKLVKENGKWLVCS
jgi:hypothetical protein